MLVVFAAILLAAPSLAIADDAGEGGTNGDGSAQPSNDGGVGGEEGGSQGSGDAANGGGDGSASADATPVIACDGDLCDTLQGRPTCAAAASSMRRTPVAPTWLSGAAVALAIGIARRARRGTSRPDRRRGAW
jgi:hypothetical protein